MRTCCLSPEPFSYPGRVQSITGGARQASCHFQAASACHRGVINAQLALRLAMLLSACSPRAARPASLIEWFPPRQSWSAMSHAQKVSVMPRIFCTRWMWWLDEAPSRASASNDQLMKYYIILLLFNYYYDAESRFNPGCSSFTRRTGEWHDSSPILY